MCYNNSMRKFIGIALLMMVCAGSGWSAQPGEALVVGGSFSAQTNVPANTRAFDADAREREIQALQEKLREGKYNDVTHRIGVLMANKFTDDRFYLLQAIAYDGLQEDENVIYTAGQAISVAPQDARAYVLRAGAYLRQKNYERARLDVEEALKLNPSSQLAKKIKKELDAQRALARGEKPVSSGNAKEIPTWMVIYVAVILLALFLFIYFRYEDLFRKQKPAYARKESEIKDQYDFIRQIGEGGMGKVFEAYDKSLKRKVAIKRVRPELVRSAYVREQFLSEARMVALLRHPCIVEIYTVIESESSLYLVFEYVDGQTLETRLDIDGRLPFSQVKEIFKYVCEGLEYAHSQDIIHCDLKPGNIMILEDNKAKVMDFGVAKKSVDHQTGARTVAGTPAYMAPEQQRGFMRKQSDVYSLALCVYEALVGQVPWTVKGFNIANKKIVPPSKLAPLIPPAVDEVLADALKEDPKERIQSIAEFWKRLEVIEPLKDDTPEITHY